jgi:hypothetical protein
MVHISNRHCRPIAVLLMIVCVLLTPVLGVAQNNPQRIRFQRGHSSTTVSGRIVGFDTRDYVVGAQAGQEMTVRLKASHPSTYFVIYTINGKPTDMNETDDWSARLTESGDYVIRVFMMRSEARRKGAVANYTLSLSIH